MIYNKLTQINRSTLVPKRLGEGYHAVITKILTTYYNVHFVKITSVCIFRFHLGIKICSGIPQKCYQAFLTRL